MKGQTFLKATSILMIIGGVIAAIVSLIGIAGVALLASLGGASGLLYLSVGIAVAASVIELIAGIKGVGACKAPEKAAACVKWGIIIAVLSVISMVVNLIGGGEFEIVNFILNLVLPVLYVIGAAQLKGAAAAQ